jgi:tRNA A22 N-methylase
LFNNNFLIVGEHLAQEGQRICEIITVKPSTFHFVGEKFLDEIDFEIPPMLAALHDPLLDTFLNDKILKTQVILDALENIKSVESKKRKLILENRLKILKERKTVL